MNDYSAARHRTAMIKFGANDELWGFTENLMPSCIPR